MIPIDLWSAEGRAEMRAHLDLIGEIEEAEAKLDALKARLPAWLGRRGVEVVVTHTWDCQPLPRLEEAPMAVAPAPAESEPSEIMGGRSMPAGEPSADVLTSEEIAAWVEDQMAQAEPGESPAPRSLPTQGAAREGRDPERLWTPELKAEAWEMAEEGLGVEDIAVKLAISYHRVRTLLAMIRDGECPAPKLASAPAAAPEAPAEAVPVEAPAAEDATDPERWIDDAMKAEIWRLDQEGYTAAGIATEMSLAQRRVQNLLYRIRSGKHPVPGDAAPSTAVATTSAHGALVVPERGVARDPEMVQQWQDEMAEAERRKFVARSEYPEMQA